MQPIEIIVIVASVLFVLGVIVWVFLRKRKGKSFCDCSDCDGNCEKCKAALKNKTKCQNQEKNKTK